MSADDLRNHVATEIGAIAKPKAIFITPDLPKTRSGKIMRRLLRDVAEGRNLGDTSTLADAGVVSELQRRASGGRRRARRYRHIASGLVQARPGYSR